MELREVLALLVALPGLITAIVTVTKSLGGRWRRVRDAGREGRLKAEEELLKAEKTLAVLEVKLEYCEYALKNRETTGPSGDG